MSDERGSEDAAPGEARPADTAYAHVPPPPPPSGPRGLRAKVAPYVDQAVAWGRAYFLEQDPTFWAAFGVFALLAVILYSRWVTTNFIFDEQEALLANPYVNASGGLRYVDAIHRDFWGLLPDRSIGSYRPVPNLIWRAIWQLSKARDGVFRQAFFHHILNVLLHAVNASLMTVVTFTWTRRRGLAWIAGLIFAACALLTEAISGIVGIADVLGGMGALLALWALSAPAWAMPFAVFTAVAFGLFSKESALVCVPLVPFAALVLAPLLHPRRPARFARAAIAFVAAAAAFYLYVELRKKWFPSPLPRELSEALPEDASWAKRTAREFLVWFHQAPLPKDPLNNPLVEADAKHRIAGALRVYFRGLVQVVFPRALSGDYSFPQEPVPDRLVFPESIAGALGMVAPPLASFVIWIVAMWRERRARVAAAAAGAGAPGDLVGVALRVLAVLPLFVVPAMVLRAKMRGLLPDEVLSPRDVGVVVGISGLFGAAAVARAWQRGRAPGADRGHLVMRIGGLACVAVALAGVGHSLSFGAIVYRGVPSWVAAIPILLLGVGLLIEGAPALADPFAILVHAPPVQGKPYRVQNPERVDPPVFAHLGARPLGLAGLLLVGVGLTWIVVSYFPHSNIPVVLPTVRAERFWYFPVIGTTLVLAVLFDAIGGIETRIRGVRVAPALLGLFFGFQAVQAYRHAMDYRSDVDFWRATKEAVPNSAKAHLNYSVMKGARGDLQTRLEESKIAMRLAPDWAMARIYTGDTLCRMHRAKEAWEHYAVGFEKDPNGLSLIALALQCLYDEKELLAHEDELRTIAAAHEGSWIAYLAIDTLNNHEKNKGVDPKHRPRGYNDGPKE